MATAVKSRSQTLTLASYQSRPRLPIEVYLEHLAVGQAMPDMPLFLTSDRYINVPLQSTYDAAFAEMPEYWRKVLDKGTSGRRKSNPPAARQRGSDE